MSIPWDQLDAVARSAVADLVRVNPVAMPNRVRAWPHDSLACLGIHLPKAERARGHTDVGANYLAHEKLNGAFVLWDGADLWTKNGNAISVPDTIRACLPPGFPFVGELFLGYGSAPRTAAAVLASNRQSRTLLDKTDRVHVWRCVRIVAFDTPIAEALAYRHRYRILCQVVGSWWRRHGQDGDKFPLQVIRQYAMTQFEAMFREVVHGWTDWSARRYPPFGIPETDTKVQTENGLGPQCKIHRLTERWLPSRAHLPAARSANGEGLMLWDQTAVWNHRGPAARKTTAVLKCKPTILTTGIVAVEPYVHGYRVETGDGGDVGPETTKPSGCDEQLQGYIVRLRWWDPLAGHWTFVHPVVSPRLDARQAVDLFPLNERVFFTFVFYDRDPMFMSAIGPKLTPTTAGQVHSGAAADDRPRVERLLRAVDWAHGDLRVFYPTTVAWLPLTFLWNCWEGHRGRARARRARVLPATDTQCVCPGDVGQSGRRRPVALRSSVPLNWTPTANARLTAWAETPAQRTKRIANLVAGWEREQGSFFGGRGLSQFLLLSALTISAWLRATTQDDIRPPSDTGGIPDVWGPFRLQRAAAAAAPYGSSQQWLQAARARRAARRARAGDASGRTRGIHRRRLGARRARASRRRVV